MDARHAAAAFRSERFLRVDGTPGGAGWVGLSGDYRAADGWVKLHGNYPHHADAVLRAIEVPDDRDAVAAAVAARPAVAVEEAVLAAGGAAAAMRTRAEWQAHPQFAALRPSRWSGWSASVPPRRLRWHRPTGHSPAFGCWS